MKTKTLFLTALALMLSTLLTFQSAFAGAPQKPEPPVFQSMPCPDDIFPTTVLVDCGFVTVPENRSRANSRTIQVAAAIIRTPSAHPKRDPIVFLDGGPSFGAISPFALDAYFDGGDLAQNRDIILVDTRGTGYSQPRLGCPEFDQADEASFYAPPYAGSTFAAYFKQAVTDCRNRLTASGIDLSAYNSAESAADLDALRRALGYQEWNMLALSADGVLGLTYMRLYPEGIRSVVIDSGASLQHLWNIDYLRGINDQLERIFGGCRANHACNAAYPDVRKVFYDLIAELQAHPADISIPGLPGGPIVFHVDGVEFYIGVIQTIFPGDKNYPETIHFGLTQIWRAGHGELDEVVRESLEGTPEFDADSSFAQGKTMSYVCRDLVAFETRADFKRAARDVPALAPYFLDLDNTLPAGPPGCQIWNVGRAEPAQHMPLASSIPTLVLAGEYDGGVPAPIVRQIPETLSNSFYYEFPASAHLQLASYNIDSTCARAIAVQFLNKPKKKPDSHCMDSLKPFDFTPVSSVSAQPSGTIQSRRKPTNGHRFLRHTGSVSVFIH